MESRESKPSWNDVPRELAARLGELLGSPIVDAEVVWGGFGPSATFLLRTGDGRRFFCKGSHPGFTRAGKRAVARERVLYETLPELSQFGPAYHGAVTEGEWLLLALDYVKRARNVPPWSDDALRCAMRMLARFHAAMPARARSILDDVHRSPLMADVYDARLGWRSLAESSNDRAQLLALFAERAAASRWIDRHIEEFVAREAEAVRLGGPHSWIHHDVRSDNLIFHDEGEPMLVDWPYLAYGPIVMDVAFFLPSVAGEGGPPPHQAMALYEAESGIRFGHDEARIALAIVAGFFAARAGMPPIPGLPRLRWVQALQLFPCLEWLSQLMNIERPPAPLPLRPPDF